MVVVAPKENIVYNVKKYCHQQYANFIFEIPEIPIDLNNSEIF